MASLSGEKEAGTTRSPTPETLVEENRNVGNINEKQLEATDDTAKADEATLGGEAESAREEATANEEEAEYASGIKLGFIVIALALSIFLVCLQSAPQAILFQRLTYSHRSHWT